MRERFERTMTGLAVSQEVAWRAMHDVELLAACSSSIEGVEEVARGRSWNAVLTSTVGKFRLSAPLLVELTGEDAGERVQVRARGSDRAMGTRLSVDAEGHLAGACRDLELRLTGEYEVTGKLATLGAALVRRHARDLIDEFWSNLAVRLEATPDDSGPA